MPPDLPQHASIVVIGGGVMGCSTLYHLAKFGVTDAILLERSQLTSGTTWHSAAQVRALRSTRNLTELIKYSISFYSALEEETGQQTGWINKGSLSIATHHDRLIHIRRQEALAHSFGVEARQISGEEAKERWPLMNAEDVIGAVWSPEDGRVSPSDLCAALAKGARAGGAKIFEGTAVVGIVTDHGEVVAVETEAGRIRCDAAAVCTGLWSRENAAMAGVDVPIWPCEHFYLLTGPVEGITGNMPTLSDHDAHLYIRDDSGGLLVGCFEPMGKPVSPETLGRDFAFQLLEEDWNHFEPMMLNAIHRLPALGHAEVKTLLNGPESFTPDGNFLLGESAETRGLYLGCGMNSMGVAAGGGAGMALARCMIDGCMPMDLYEADPRRFPGCFSSVEALSARAPEVLGRHYEITYPGRQPVSARNLRSVPLENKWKRANAHFNQLYGWERPMYFDCAEPPDLTFSKPPWFDQVGREVAQACGRAAVFDQSTFGKIRVTGPDAEKFLNRVCANNMKRPPGSVIYSAMLNRRGGFESDLTAFRTADEEFVLFTASAEVKRDYAWMKNHLHADERAAMEDMTDDWAVIGLMGPRAGQTMRDSGAPDVLDLNYFQHGIFEIGDIEVRAARLSYVGESGWEMICASDKAEALYDLLHDRGARPAGMYAQISMRIEKRYLSYGHDLNTDINPFEAGLDFALDWNSDFIGREALLRIRDKEQKNTMVSIVFDDKEAVPLGNEPICHGREIIGQTTSASFGYRVQKPVALGYIQPGPEGVAEGLRVEVNIAGVLFSAKVVKGAVFDPDGSRMRTG